ncbi:hypothetical protein HNQ80_002544 [Anaerosolibacter carboniphilus]|uniref:Uncharacterized protein n=1 Tax=Anaerosolibacter carboniphilus TaxID=1417629 RepID=A0A841KRS3_9FIRM|nr:hypothetical protein [Anaerosolibacter carboniphilus]MBB6216444.1 hypothetical protein [Anaerosolibacter carboniphilus]
MHIRGVELYNMDVFANSRRVEGMNRVQRIDPIGKDTQNFTMKNEIKKNQLEYIFKPIRTKTINGSAAVASSMSMRLIHRNEQILFNTSINAKLAYMPMEEVSGKNIDYMI